MAADPMIASTRPRELFAEWVADALADTRPPPSGLASAYLIDLLAGRVAAPGPAPAPATPDPGRPDPEGSTLAEAWLHARRAGGALRLASLRSVGDRALFVAGFFGPSLTRKVVGVDYYRDIGQAAYVDLARSLADRSFRELYHELAVRFGDCIAVLARVSDRAYPGVDGGVEGLLHQHERWLATGDPGARRALAAAGCFVGDRGAGRRVQ